MDAKERLATDVVSRHPLGRPKRGSGNVIFWERDPAIWAERVLWVIERVLRMIEHVLRMIERVLRMRERVLRMLERVLWMIEHK